MNELCFMPATELAAAIARRDVSAREATDAVLARIEATEPTLNAFVTVCAQRARTEADAIDARVGRGEAVGPLAGVPLSVKDLVNTDGVRTTFGSAVFEHNVPATDAFAVARLRAAGAVLVGKTATPEFGHKPITYTPLFGWTANPWDTSRSPGGSSGGAGAAVAAGCGPLGLGTDGGGSIRIPAACCGIVGMKASLGLVPHDQTPDVFNNLAYFGPMTRTVDDAALMLSVMAGADPSDPHSLRLPDFEPPARRDDLRGLRLAWAPRLGNEVVARDVLAASEAAVAALADAGAEVELLDEPFENAEPMWRVMTFAAWAARFGAHAKKYGNRMDPTLVESMEKGRSFGAVELQHAMGFRSNLYKRFAAIFERYDALVTPTLSRTAVDQKQELFGPFEIDGQRVESLRADWYPYTHPFNLTGHPALTIPNGFGHDGLPLALQLVGPWDSDGLLLQVAGLLERARPWADKRPPL